MSRRTTAQHKIIESGYDPSWMVFDVNTENLGGTGTPTKQFQIPFQSTALLTDCVVDWGDGLSDSITVWNQAELLHTYSVGGTYTVIIKGTVTNAFAFDNTGDKWKITTMRQWSNQLMSASQTSRNYMFGCSNLTADIVADILILRPGTFSRVFSGCSSLTNINRVNEWDVSGPHASFGLGSFFENCSNLDILIDNWDLSLCVGLNNFMRGCTLSTPNYDALLIRMNNTGITASSIHFGSSQYTLGGAAEAARTNLIANGLSIVDGGGV